MVKLAFIGAGRMAEALISGLLSKETLLREEIIAADVDESRLSLIADRYGVETTVDNGAAAGKAEFVLLAVKPQNVDQVAAGLRAALDPAKVIISIVAGAAVSRIQALTGADIPVIRVMPNAPALVNQGISAAAVPGGLPDEKRAFVDRLLKAAGEVVYVDESLIDAVTAVSGSGPAYFFLFVKALAEAGAKAGLTNEMALCLARQTFIGSAALLGRAGQTEEELIKAVASPGGTTEAALTVFTSSDFQAIVARAVQAALARAKELANA